MSGTRAGSLKAVKTIKENHGEDYYKKIGSLGGKAQVPKGFAMNPKLASEAGSKGGKISRRSK